MAIKLAIKNPSSNARSGHFVVPWDDIQGRTGTDPRKLVVTDLEDKALPTQDDATRKAEEKLDPTRREVLFSLPSHRPSPGAGKDDYAEPTGHVWLTDGDPARSGDNVCRVDEPDPSRIEMANGRLTVSINLKPETAPGSYKCYAGAATSVRFGTLEMLDPLASMAQGACGHDPEKRCMQVDRLRVLMPGWGDEIYHEMTLFDQTEEKRLLAGLLNMQRDYPQCPVGATVRVLPPAGTHVTTVEQLPDRKPIRFEQKGPYVQFKVKPFDALALFLVRYERG